MRRAVVWTYLAISTAVAVAAVWGGVCELFVDRPGVHFARIPLDQTVSHTEGVGLQLGVPTVTHALMLVLGVVLLATTLSIAWKKGERVGRLLPGIQVASVVGVVGAYLVWAMDFFSTALAGVG